MQIIRGNRAIWDDEGGQGWRLIRLTIKHKRKRKKGVSQTPVAAEQKPIRTWISADKLRAENPGAIGNPFHETIACISNTSSPISLTFGDERWYAASKATRKVRSTLNLQNLDRQRIITPQTIITADSARLLRQSNSSLPGVLCWVLVFTREHSHPLEITSQAFPRPAKGFCLHYYIRCPARSTPVVRFPVGGLMFSPNFSLLFSDSVR